MAQSSIAEAAEAGGVHWRCETLVGALVCVRGL